MKLCSRIKKVPAYLFQISDFPANSQLFQVKRRCWKRFWHLDRPRTTPEKHSLQGDNAEKVVTRSECEETERFRFRFPNCDAPFIVQTRKMLSRSSETNLVLNPLKLKENTLFPGQSLSFFVVSRVFRPLPGLAVQQAPPRPWRRSTMKLSWDKFQLLSIRADKIGNGCQTCSTGLESVRNGSAVLVLVGKVLRHVGENQIRDKCASHNEGHRWVNMQHFDFLVGRMHS